MQDNPASNIHTLTKLLEQAQAGKGRNQLSINATVANTHTHV